MSHNCNPTDSYPYYCRKCGRTFTKEPPTGETGRVFYVSVIDGSRKALAAGPFQDHQDALEAVDVVREYVQNHDVKGAFYAYGTAGYDVSDGAKPPIGKLNKHLEIEMPATIEG